MTAPPRPWTCPFCPLLCDAFGVVAGPDGKLRLSGADCHRAQAALSSFEASPPAVSPRIGGQAAGLDAATAAAARLLASSRQPLFGGLGTDLAGARALYALACATGAICDAAPSTGLMQGVRATQDRGGFGATLGELHTRADFVLCFGGLPSARYPEFFRRIGMAADDARVLSVAEGEDPFDAAAGLAALVEGRAMPEAPAAWRAAAARWQGARYGVLVYETARLGVHAALVIEMLQRAVATLNRSTRAAALALGGDAGAATVNQVFTWLSGLPLRSRPGAHGLEHDPVGFDAGRLCADGAVDLVLWIASYGTEPPPLTVAARGAFHVPTIVVAHPAASGCAADVFIPVATPGIGSDGHLFRTDGLVLMPLHAARPDALPTVAQVLGALRAWLP